MDGVVAGLRRGPLGVDPMSRHCSNCRTPMALLFAVLLASASLASAAYGDDDPAAKASAQNHADAREFGIFFGGTAFHLPNDLKGPDAGS